jgi:predicted dehydrogenase
MNISIIGAGRTRNGIGEHIGKYFHKHGGKVTSVLGTTEKTSLKASSVLRKYGIEAHPYTDFDEMIKTEKPDAVVIASPSSTHYGYLLKSLNSGLHIFCEKPFIWNGHKDLRKMVEEMFEKALRKKLTIAMNSQWSFSIDAYEAICGKIVIQKSNTFFIKMSPPFPGREMISESVPHALSLLYCLLGAGEIEELHFESEGEKEMSIRFVYLFGTEVCEVLIRLTFQETMPRDFSFGLNDKIVFRSLDPENYEIYFHYGEKRLGIIDPLELSVKNFMEAVEKETEPFIGMLHILHNMSLLKEIDDGFGEFEKRNLWKS